MANPFYQQLGNKTPMNPMLQQFFQFRKNFNGNPQQIIQNMLNSGRISQAQVNKCAQQANQLYDQLKPFM